MRRMPWLAYFWPGLPQLWRSGLWWGLFLAAGFAVLLDLLLLTSFVWVELLGPLDLKIGWLAVGALWCCSAIVSYGSANRGPGREATSSQALFREALSEYLRGSWFEAETILGRLLRHQPRDVEARLLLATLLRRTRRYDEALDQLDRLERLKDAARWTREIGIERQLGAEAIAADQTAKIDSEEPVSDDNTSPVTQSRQAA